MPPSHRKTGAPKQPHRRSVNIYSTRTIRVKAHPTIRLKLRPDAAAHNYHQSQRHTAAHLKHTHAHTRTRTRRPDRPAPPASVRHRRPKPGLIKFKPRVSARSARPLRGGGGGGVLVLNGVGMENIFPLYRYNARTTISKARRHRRRDHVERNRTHTAARTHVRTHAHTDTSTRLAQHWLAIYTNYYLHIRAKSGYAYACASLFVLCADV